MAGCGARICTTAAGSGARPPGFPKREHADCPGGMPALSAVAGVDEVGRGPLVGPVVAAAVILRPDRPIEGAGDSKGITASNGGRRLPREAAFYSPATRGKLLTPRPWRRSENPNPYLYTEWGHLRIATMI